MTERRDSRHSERSTNAFPTGEDTRSAARETALKHALVRLTLQRPRVWEYDTRAIRPGVRVVDGDTIDVNGTRIRFQGIDTPETGQSCRDAAGEVYSCGLVASAALTLKIGEGGVRCDLEPERDRYGRALGTCYAADGTDLNGWLVRNGYGLAYRRYSERYVAQEDAARAESVGMHSGYFVPPWDWRKGKRLQ